MEAILGLIDLDIDVIKYLSVLRSKPTSARLIPFILAKISARNLKYNGRLLATPEAFYFPINTSPTFRCSDAS